MFHLQPVKWHGRSGLKYLSVSSVFAQAVMLTVLWLAACWVGNAHAAQAGAIAPTSFAVVFRLEGELTASGPKGTRALHVGDAVAVGERIVASGAGEGVLKTQDGGYIAIRPGADFMAQQFAAEGKPTDTSQLNLAKGALRIISGWIGKINPPGSRVSTSTATIGIRGTDHEPYVLLNADAKATQYKPGTYDKVNQGGTTLEAGGQSIDIDPGKVGFVRSVGKTRALLTLLFPVLLDKVPDFYVPGKFDAEMDELSKTAQANNERELQARQKQVAMCVPDEVAKRWLKDLDEHIVRGQAAPILAMFAPDVRVKATVRGANGKMTELELERAEFADSIVTAMSSLRDYKHRRITTEGQTADAGAAACASIRVKSIVIEEGRQADKPYRFESEEKYLLKQVDGIWLAVEAQTLQR
ncbi:MAG: hypothetical protein PHH58_10695 [Rhodoferax sp.]|nr:hypothetical protein [Rhodoferax sp.]